MSASPSVRRPRPLWWKIVRGLLWFLGGLVALVLAIVLIFVVSSDARGWAASRLLTDSIIKNRMASLPPRNDAQPVRRVNVRMRDGVELSTQIFLPKGEGPWPVILVRDPYSFSHYVGCAVFVRYGYACVSQDVRGRGQSKGAWYPFIDERRDGLDTIAWVLRQPWQNRRMALYGGSYLGVVQWAVAGDLPPEVKTFAPTVSHGDVYRLAYRNGVFNEGVGGVWLHSQFKTFPAMLFANKDWGEKIAARFPAQGVDPAAFGPAWKSYSDYIRHPERDDPYWQSADYVALREAHRKVRVPVFMVGAANDFFLGDMIRTYDELPTRDQSVMMIGPGNHGGKEGPEIEGGYDTDYADTLAWFDHYLKGAPLPQRLQPGINVFIHGAATWKHYARWPIEGAPLATYRLDRLADAQACDGGTLVQGTPAASQKITYTYDPRHPVPTRGGPFLLISDAVTEQDDDLCARDDVLSFASTPLAQGGLLSGPVRVRLRVSSDAADTAFTVKLQEHFADGRVYNIRDDISSLSLRNGATHRMTYRPGEEVEVVFDMTPIAWRLQPGSRLRLDVSSSSSPAFHPHPNRAGLWSAVADPVSARQTLHGGTVEIPLEP